MRGIFEAFEAWAGSVRSPQEPSRPELRAAGLLPALDRVQRPQRRLAVVERGTSIDYVAALCRTWCAGDVAVAIDPRLPAAEVARRLELAGAETSAAALPPRPAGPADLALVVFTSGTTGRPRAVGLTQENLLACAAAVADAHRLGPADRCLNTLSFAHVNAPVVGLLATVLSGGDLVLAARFDPRSFWRLVTATAATWANLAPPLVSALADAPPSTADRDAARTLRFVRTASAPIAPAVVERFERRFGVAVVESYGISEAASQVTANDVPPGERRRGWVGRPRGVEVKVALDDGSPTPPGATGEVMVRGRAVTPGYLGDPEATRARIVDGWLRTGDVGVMDEAGWLRIVGRRGDLINRGGDKVAPRVVEEAIQEVAGVVDAAVVGVPDPVYGEEIAALVVAGPGISAGDVRRQVAARLPVFARPRMVFLVARLPKDALGKVDRRRASAEARRRARELAAQTSHRIA